MAIDFPTSPSTNDTHTTTGGITYKWDGTSWKAQGSTTQYILPTASSTLLGGIKIGSRLTITAGVLEADVQASSYGNSDVDTHLNQSNPTSGYVLSWNGSDYAWVDNAGYSNTDVDTHLNQSNPTSGHVLSWNGSDYAWVAQTGGSTSSRTTANASTGSLAAGEHALLDINSVAKSYGLMKIQTSHAAWVTLYISQAARSADVNRSATTDPVPGAGVVAEVITNGDTTQVISPMLMGFNDESSPVDTVYAKVRNETGSATVIQVTLTFVPLES